MPAKSSALDVCKGRSSYKTQAVLKINQSVKIKNIIGNIASKPSDICSDVWNGKEYININEIVRNV